MSSCRRASTSCRAALAYAGGADIGQFAFQGKDAAGPEVAHGGDFGAVVVAAGQVVEEIPDGADVQGGQAGGGFGVHPAQFGYRVVGVAGFGGRLRGGGGAAAGGGGRGGGGIGHKERGRRRRNGRRGG